MCLFCFFFFFLRVPELPVLSREVDCVQNLHVSAHTDSKSITMLYEVHQGESNRSFGVHAAEVADFPPSVVRVAREKALELERLSGDVSAILVDSTTTNADEQKIESTPPGSQEPITSSPAHVTGSGSGKRVQPNPQSSPVVVPVPAYQAKFFSRKMADFEDDMGNVDMKAFAEFVNEIRAMKHEEEGVQPMQM